MDRDLENIRANVEGLSSEAEARLLEEKIPEILKVWEARVRSAAAVAQHLDTYALVNHIPKFLKNLVHVLRGDQVATASIRSTEIPREHGEQRTQLEGYNLSQVIEEFRILREVIFEILERNAPMGPRMRDTILQAIDIGIQQSVETYSEVELDRERAATRRAKDAEAIINALIEGSPVGFGLIDHDMRYLRVNQVLAKLNGRPAEFHIGRTVREVLPNHADRIESLLRKILETGKPVLNQQIEVEVPGDGGKIHHFLTNYFPVITDSGKVIGVGGAVADISEQKAFENLLRTSEEFKTRLIESSEDCFKILDLEGHLTFIADKSAEHLEIDSPASVVGKKWVEFWRRTEDQEQARAAVMKAAAGGRAEFIGNYRTPSGKREWWHVVLTPMLGRDQKPENILAVSRDVTALRKTEERREELTRLLNLTHDAILVRDEEDKILYWNHGAEIIFGYSPDEAVGQKTHELLKTKFTTSHEAINQKLLRDGFWNGELIHTLKDGRRVVSMSRWVLDKAEGRPTRILESNSDITYLKAAERELREREELFRTIFELAAAGKVVVDVATGCLQRVNRKFCEMLGYSEAELLQKTFLDVTHPDDKRWQQSTFNEGIAANRPWSIEKRYIRKDGSTIWVLVSASVLEYEGGKAKSTISTVFDITDRKHAEEELRYSRQRFQLLAEAAPQIVWISDPKGNSEYYNSRWMEFTGLSLQESLGQGWKKAIHPDDLRLWPEVVGNGDATVTFEERKRGKNGNYCWFLVRIVPVRDDSGKVVRLIGTATDIDQQKQTQRMLQEEKDLRERFTNALAHDLRNPLTAAKMSTQIALRNVADTDRVKRVLGGTIESINRADKMIVDLLDASRIKAGQKLPLKIAPCDLREIAEQSIKDLSLVHGMRFEIKGPSEIQGEWSCDGLRRVFDNLLTNAIKYGEKEKVITIHISDDSEKVYVSVHNFGKPIPKEEQESLFDIFRRSGTAEKSGEKGWGIGLTLVRGIIESQGGHIAVESEAGIGTTFTFDLPLHP